MNSNARIEAEFQAQINERLVQIRASLERQGYTPEQYRIHQVVDLVDGCLTWKGKVEILPKPKATA